MQRTYTIARLSIAVMLLSILAVCYGWNSHTLQHRSALAVTAAADGSDADHTTRAISDLFVHFARTDNSHQLFHHKEHAGSNGLPGYVLPALDWQPLTGPLVSDPLRRTAYKQLFTPVQLLSLYPFHSFW